MRALHLRKATTGVGLLLSLALIAPPPPPADAGTVVVVHNRGTKIKPTGRDAEDLERICSDLVRHARSEEGPPATEHVRYLRANEVAVEVHYDAPQNWELPWTTDRARPQHLFVSLTGPFTGYSGNDALVFSGRTPERNEPNYFPLEYYNGPDEYGVQYVSIYNAPGQLEELRVRVAQFGVDAPRPTPRPTQAFSLTPMRADEEEKD